MSEHRLRVVATTSAPERVTRLRTFTFANVGGELIILHDDDRLTAPQALVEIMQLLRPALVADAAGCSPARVRLPGEICSGEMFDDAFSEAQIALRRILPAEQGDAKLDQAETGRSEA